MSLRQEFENEIKNTKGGISVLFETRNQQYIEWLEGKVTELRQDAVTTVCECKKPVYDLDMSGVQTCLKCKKIIDLQTDL